METPYHHPPPHHTHTPAFPHVNWETVFEVCEEAMSYVLEVKFLYGRVILYHWVIKADGFNEQLPVM